MSTPEPISVAVVGVGRMGRLHARTYRQLPGVELAAVVDPDTQRAAAAGRDFNCKSYTSVDDLLAAHPEVKAISVAVPTRMHRTVAEQLLPRRIACLVEKPLAPDGAEARAILKVAEQAGAVLQVGHSERFNPAVRALLALKPQALYIEVQRVSPLTFRSMDVGVVMDMMIHDLDIVLALARSPLKAVEAVGFAVAGEREDIANARLVFESGCVANVTASRLALKTDRRLKLLAQSLYVSLDYRKRKGLVIRRSDDAAAVTKLREQIAAGVDLSHLDYSRFVKVKPLRMEDGMSPRYAPDPLTAELGSFLECVRNGRTPEVDGVAGCAAVEAAGRILEAIRKHHWVGVM